MLGWIGEVIPPLVVWSALLSNGVFSQEIVGFEPRDSMFDKERDVRSRRIEVNDSDVEGTTRSIPIELEPDLGERGRFCESCPFCLMCTKKYQTDLLPRWMMGISDLLIVYSMNEPDVKVGIEKFVKHHLGGALRRAGLLPLRIFVERCRLMTSLFVGLSRVCNCDPRPDSYQFYLEDADKMFKKLEYQNCIPRIRQCRVTVSSIPFTAFWVKQLYGPPSDYYSLIVPIKNFTATYVVVPRFMLNVSFEMVQHPDFSETFVALSRHELHQLVTDIGSHQGTTGSQVFGDVEVFLHDKIRGVQRFCYKIGTKPQKYRTLEPFHKIDKHK